MEFLCSCGKNFPKELALKQHQRDRVRANPASTCRDRVAGNEEKDAVLATSSAKSAKSLWSIAGKKDWLQQGTGVMISSISYGLLGLSGNEPRVSSSGGYELLCSYNWINRAQPSIYVPGAAPKYKEVAVPMVLDKDSGLQYIDQNAARLAQYPFEVVFNAIELMNPYITFDAIDILVNRNSLRRLLEFCQKQAMDSFRLNLFVIGNTLIIERCTKTAKQMLHGSGDPGYGKAFEQAVTENHTDLQDSMAHHCVLKYELGGLECAVRFEVDACVASSVADSQTGPRNTNGSQHYDAVDRLAGDLQAMGLGMRNPGTGIGIGSMQVIPCGTGTSPSHMAEIKANAKPPGKSMPQLWFGRTSFLVRGSHDESTFTKVSVDNVSQKFEEWESSPRNQMALQKMVSLLSQLRDIVKGTEKKSCVAVYRKNREGPVLQIFDSTAGRSPLPIATVQRFWTSQS
ncbi:hypothetical protein SCAR479_05548 [Seiridium cardinale]|uniref:Uncharacterized protein n=1 Tax=Seiridium cardinale TaxID=138064 RepID=A0ABR2XWE0_9PEZI